MKTLKCPNCGETIELTTEVIKEILSDSKNEELQKEIDSRVAKEIEALEEKFELESKLAEQKLLEKKNNEIFELKTKAEILEQKVNAKDKDIEVAVLKALEGAKEEISKKTNEITKLQSEIVAVKADAKSEISELNTKHETEIKLKDADIERWKNFRMGDSTKDLGESLEQYCHNAFEEVRAIAYPNAYFEKDNDATLDPETQKLTKGDFIFRDFSDDNIELVSIMFEMKTEKETTETKHKNEDFFKKLDADRKKKNCEYAVLVTTLEADNALYNKGIVDVSHKFQKMFVVRPQFFMAIIGLLRSMSLKSYEYRKQVAVYQSQNVDIVNFEANIKAVADKINADYAKAANLYDGVDKMCDDMIKKITAFRETFRKAQGHLGAAQNQLDNLSVRKLTKNNPTMKAKFDELAVEHKE